MKRSRWAFPSIRRLPGDLGAVDELLVGDGRLRVLDTADDPRALEAAPSDATRTTRNPALLLDLMLSALER